MIDLLIKDKHLDRSSAYVLASNAMNLRITQLVDGKVGVHALVRRASSSRTGPCLRVRPAHLLRVLRDSVASSSEPSVAV